LERTYLDRPAYVVSKQEAARLAGTNTSVASGHELDACAAAWLHAELRAGDGLQSRRQVTPVLVERDPRST
jgi:hypothetical protein